MSDPDRARKTVTEINQRLRRGEAVVLTAQEFKAGIRSGRRYTPQDIDVVTTATRGIMSGTAAMFSVPVAARGVFLRAEQAWLNGVPAFPGPAPNERLGYTDVMVYGTSPSRDAPKRYGGGHLFRDLLEGKEILIEIVTEEGTHLARRFTIDELDFARMYNTRNVFMNYSAFGNFKGDTPQQTIFSFRPMGPESGVTVIGSGEMNPLQNDPSFRTIGAGTQVLVNGAPGRVVGHGTRATAEKPNLSIVADMFQMDPRYMGGFITSAGVEVLNSVAIPIPVLDDAVLETLSRCLDENIALPIADLSDRIAFAKATYADVWQGRSLDIVFDPSRRCAECVDNCIAEETCPVDAISWQALRLDHDRCVSCGACAVVCRNGAFQADLGTIDVLGRPWPITFRMSDRRKGFELAERLKTRMTSGAFMLAEDVAPITFRQVIPKVL